MIPYCGCDGCVTERLNLASGSGEQNGNQEYNLNGVRWEVDPLVHQAGATVTWSIATANYLADYIQFDGFIADAQFISVIRAAFDAWEQVTNIDFVEVSDSSNVDIRLGFGDIDGSSGTLGVAYYSWNGSNELTQSFIEFDSAENWNLNIGSANSGIGAYIVALHEIGHAIGIGHSGDSGAVMAAFLNNSLSGLTQDDIDAAQAIYGALGGGGGGSNSAPDAVVLSADTVTENSSGGTLIGLLSASDPDAGDTHTFDIVSQSSGPGWSNFAIVSNQLQVAGGASIDYESNTSFQLTIRATDQDGLSFDQSLTVQVGNQAISDIALASGGTVVENASGGTAVATFAAFENGTPEVAQFTLVNDAGGRFVLDGNVLRVASGADLDFESDTSHTVRIRTTDGNGPAREENFTIQVNNVPVSDITMSGGSVSESTQQGTAVAQFQVFEGADAAAAQLTLINDAGGRFVLDGDVLRLAPGARLDFESATSHTVRVRATDGNGPAREENFTIQVNNVPVSDITMSGGSVSESTQQGAAVAQFQVFEGANAAAAQLTLVDDAGGLFVLDGDVLRLAPGARLDFESATSHTVRVRATDGNGPAREENFTIQVNNVPVSDITMSGGSVAENAAGGTTVAQLQAFDEDLLAAPQFTLVDDAGGLFILDGDTLKLAPGAQLDFESNTNHTVRVSASDGNGPAREEEFTVQVSNTPISDIVLATGGSVVESAAAGTEVATFQAFDDRLEPNAQFTLVDDAGGRFVLDGSALRVAQGAVLDFEDASSHTVRIRATDGSGPAREEDFVVQVSNTSISDIALVSGGSIIENSAPESVVATFEAYEAGGIANAQFILIDNAGGLFVLDQNVLKVADGAAIDYETATSHTIRLQAVDGSGQPYEEQFVIQIGNMAISDIALSSGGSVDENAAADTVVATFEASENPLEPAALYTLIDDAGGLFYLDGNALRVADGAILDFEAAASHTVRVGASDGTGPSHAEDFVIQVNDLGGGPVTGDSGDNNLAGTGEDDQIQAGAGDDTVQGSQGSDTINGESGYDTVVYDGTRAEFQQDLLNHGLIRVDKQGGGSDLLIGIERIDLDDGDFVYDIHSPNLGFGYRVYRAAFGRDPDEGGLRFWVNELDLFDQWGWSEDAKLNHVASAFYNSEEFRLIYGDNVGDDDYIEAMYVNVLRRPSDAEGHAYWVGRLQSDLTREDMLIFFAQSEENRIGNSANLDDGVWVL